MKIKNPFIISDYISPKYFCDREAETKRINEAVKNNPDKFPIGYILELSKKEWDSLKSNFSTLKGCDLICALSPDF